MLARSCLWIVAFADFVVVLAASLNMEYPLNDTLPKMTHVRDRLLAKIFEFRQSTNKKTIPTDNDYELLYCYGAWLPVLITGNVHLRRPC